MKTTITRTLAAALGAGALAASMQPASAAPAREDVPSFQEFKAATFQDVGGQYVVNGDETIATTQELRTYYDSMVGSKYTDSQSLVINTVGGADDKWSATTARNLTYCVSDRFGSYKSAMVSAMQSGAGQWEAASSG
ncbi:hypothetical protein [Nocardioides glacieisoli]|uniref:hypothetical protein n=1 Tax=Nocardioides glacieisoli TaxID=1168730 RepID=UPI001A91C1DA|nr:hypothetical protein [Nocardioides glacieisoli]